MELVQLKIQSGKLLRYLTLIRLLACSAYTGLIHTRMVVLISVMLRLCTPRHARAWEATRHVNS